jgi:agmatinase
MSMTLAEAIALLAAGNPPSPEAGFLGVDVAVQDAALVLLGVPWEATTSYGGGTATAPAAIVTASHQLDVQDAAFGQFYRHGITMVDADAAIARANARARPLAKRHIEAVEQGGADVDALAEVNRLSAVVDVAVAAAAARHLDAGRAVGVVGGDHASPFGLMSALAARHPAGYGVLHIDAHMDLRAAYEGFERSHASIFFNVLQQLPQVTRLVQVGVRDFSRDEVEVARAQGERVVVHDGRALFQAKARGRPFAEICDAILAPLPPDVYVSFDIDGLDAPYCPHTGTPVPGGLSFDEAVFLIERLARSGRRIIGFDLCEVAPGPDGDEWDANVGARLLFKLCGALLVSATLVSATLVSAPPAPQG